MHGCLRVLCLPFLAGALTWSAAGGETIRIAFREIPGYSFLDEDGSRVGYTTEWFRRLALRFNWNIEWVDVGYGGSALALEIGHVDLSPFVLTPEREHIAFEYTHVPIGFFRMGLLVPEDSGMTASELWKRGRIVVGMMGGNPLRQRMEALFDSRGVKCSCVEFTSEGNLLAALKSGEVEAVLGELTDSLRGVRLLVQFPATPFYIAVAKSREDLVPVLDEAVSEIADRELEFVTMLRRRYFRNEGRRQVAFTPDEWSWLERQRDEGRSFTIDVTPVDGFLKVYDEKSASVAGLVGRIFSEVTAVTGLRFVSRRPKSTAEVKEDFMAGGVDIHIPYGSVENDVCGIGDPSRTLAIKIPQALATRHLSGIDITDGRSTIAVVATDHKRINAYRRFRDADRMRIFGSGEDALQAVLDGEADCFLGDYPLVSRLVSRLDDPMGVDVRVMENARYNPELQVLVGPKTDLTLVSVLAKVFSGLNRDQLVIFEDMSEKRESDRGRVRTRDVFRYSGAGLLVIFAVVIVVLLHYSSKIRRLLHRSEASLQVAQDAIDDAAVARTEMREALDRAEYAAKVKSNFLATMSHEIRTPLNAVVGFSEFLTEPGVTPEKVGEYARGISLSANALLSLINDILDLSKFESGRKDGLDIRHGECEVSKLFTEMESVFGIRTSAKGLTLEFEGASSVPALVLDEARMRQIFFNLLGNAVKFTERGGIVARVEYADGVFRLSVKDTGIGISRRGIERIFDPFEQDFESRGGRVYAGTGLGLSIVKRIVEASSGVIRVDSRIGAGSTFFIEIPGVAVANPRSGAAAASPTAVNRNLRHVVIVDDVAMNRKILKMHCEALGIRDPAVFESGAEVLDYLSDASNPCDLLLTDIWMPGMNGSELVKRCLEIRPGLPVVAVTADTDSGATFDISLFDSVLTKPVTRTKLSALLANLRGVS